MLADGFIWAEGPVWVNDEKGGHLLFSDIPRNSVMKWREGVGVDLFLKPSGYTGASDYGNEPGSNGLLLDSKGRLVSCEHGDRRISVMSEKGGKMTLINNYQGKDSTVQMMHAFIQMEIYILPIHHMAYQSDIMIQEEELDFCEFTDYQNLEN